MLAPVPIAYDLEGPRLVPLHFTFFNVGPDQPTPFTYMYMYRSKVWFMLGRSYAVPNSDGY